MKKDDDVMGRAAIQSSGMPYLLHHAIINMFNFYDFFANIMHAAIHSVHLKLFLLASMTTNQW